ncbi:MBL fold metallo-hydrolase [Bordetella petrii]|uniref:MBL fold metallo-hydrolase n=1 Tax=Bordetella petrii TaxID=94624 RepID=UPI001A97CD89|nr:MBL fold metallo-hydrolase [Bordetella petrii]MBO1114274.1 MBL fold metallo-hydrolase [Bordetella petrii]
MKILADGAHAIYMIGGGGMGVSHPTDAHIYVVDGGSEAAMIDAGSGIQPEWMQSNLASDGVPLEKIRQIVLTHTHWDHARGCAWWQRATGARILAHSLGRATVEEGEWAHSHVARRGIPSQGASVARSLEDGDEIAVGGLRLQVVHTPGHSSDSISLLLQFGGKRVLFGGDTVFAEGGHGTVSANTDFRAYRDSVRRLAALEIDALLPSHKQFVLSRAHEHVAMLERKLSANWTDVVTARVPFFPTWWLEHDASLYEDAVASASR